MIQKTVSTFPELRSLMAKYGLTYQDLGTIIGNTYQTASKKLKEIYTFNLTDMEKVKKYFISLGEPDVKIDKLFFDWKVTNMTFPQY